MNLSKLICTGIVKIGDSAPQVLRIKKKQDTTYISMSDGDAQVTYPVAKEDDRYYYVDNERAKFQVQKDTNHLDGLYKSFWEYGSPEKKLQFKDGKLNGRCERYDDDGHLEERSMYVDGMKNGPSKSFWANGQLKEKCTYRDDKLNGYCEEYYDNGQLYIKCFYKNGELEGSYEEYNENGQLKEKCTYKNGKKNGECEERDMRGRLITRKFYEDNSLTHDATLPLKEKSYRKLIGEK